MNRTKFIQTAFRITILGVMAAVVAVFARKQQLTLYANCPENVTCKNCGKLKSCALPKAENVKENG